MVLLTALLVPMFALALQSEKRAELANERIDFFRRMASSSSHNNNGIPLATLFEWYKIRDTFFGHNYVTRNIPSALQLASSCHHPDARWLTETCAGKDVNTREDAKRIFSSLGQNDARALCFMWMLGDGEDFTPLRRSAELGFAFAQAFLFGRTEGEESFTFAQMAAAQGERDGYYWLGWCFRDGEGCEKDLEKAKENFLLASELGYVWAMNHLAELLGESDPQRWRWWGRAAALEESWLFLSNFAKQVELFNACSGSAAAMFAMGQALQGYVNEQARTIFNWNYDFDSWIDPAKQAIAFYEAQIKATKDAMRAWTQVGIKLKVVKDVRKLIARLIWDSREEALYDVSARRLKDIAQCSQPSARALRAQKIALKGKNRFFSQEMASSSSHNNGIPLTTLLEWYKIRDTFFGDNYVSQNIPLAIGMASSCQHPDARWLAEACAGKAVTTEEGGKRVFSALGQNDARALCFAWRLGSLFERRDLTSLRRSAELGFAFAQVLFGGWSSGEERFKFAQLAASQGERDGFYWLAHCFRDGEGCEKNLDKAREKFLLASELDHVLAMCFLGNLLEESDPQRWRWWGRAAALGDSLSFLSSFVKQVDLVDSCSEKASVMFAIGEALQGHVNEEERMIFNEAYDFFSWIGPAKQAIAFYEAQIKATKDAMHAWTLVGIHFNVVKDLRKLIAKLIWDSREEALYDVSNGEKEQEAEEEAKEEEEEEEEPMRAQKGVRK
jgi:TPR repeat protein